MPTTKPTKKESRAKVTPAAKGASVSVVTQTGEVDKPWPVNKELLSITPNPQLLATVVRVYQSAQHQGTQSTKTRGEVTGSTRKIYRQKGTGRARHGAITAPIFVGGGIVFGPKPRDLRLTIPKKMQRAALLQVLSNRLTHDGVRIVSGLSKTSGKTKDMVTLFKKMQLTGKQLILVLDPDMKSAHHGARNVSGVTIRSPQSLSTLDVLKHEYLVFSLETVDKLLKRVIKN